MYTFVTILLLGANVVHSFNIESDANRLEFSIAQGKVPDIKSHFGYAIGFFKTSAYKLIVSAPEATNKTGNLYECSLQKGAAACTNIEIASNASFPKNIGLRGGAEQLGRFLTTTKNNVIACSPMWNNEDLSIQSANVPLYGRCLTLDKNLKVEDINSPCHQLFVQKITTNRHGYCQAGHMAGYVKSKTNGDYRILSGIGSWRYRGSLVVVKDSETVSDFTNLEGQKLEPNEERFQPDNVVPASESTSDFTEIHSLLGFVTTTGSFQGPTFENGIAAGAPRDKTLYGQVVVYGLQISTDGKAALSRFSQIDNPDKSTGSFFGGSIASVDFNNDGFDDLLVGAPLFASGNGNLQGQDEGKVYIFKNIEGKRFVREEYDLIGLNQKGARFGTTITNVGDINGDGTEDIAIGAPFGGIGGKGTVFIYNVRNNKLNEDFSQIINSPEGNGFGFSIAAEKVDTRIYPALAVGAPLDGQVYVFQAKTVITLKDILWVNSTRVPPESSRFNCIGPDNKKYHCVTFIATLEDISTNPPKEFDLEIDISVDTTNSLGFGKRRALMLDTAKNTLIESSTQKLTFQRRGKVAINKTIFFSTEKTTDFGSPITISTKYSSYDTPLNCENGLCAILDEFGALNSEIEVKYRRKCGGDDKCDIDVAIEQPSIQVAGSQNDKLLLLGSDYEEVLLNAIVTNYNESAYLATMTVTYSVDFELVQMKVNDRNVDLIPDEDEKNNTKSTINKIRFLLANPILQDQRLVVAGKFAMRGSLRAPTLPEYYFNMLVESTGHDYNLKNNNKTLSIKSGIESCLKVKLDGRNDDNKPQPMIYETTKEIVRNIQAVEDVGPLGKYQFLIQNSGRKVLENMTVELSLIDHFVNLNEEKTKVLYVYELTGGEGTICNTTGVNDGDYQVEELEGNNNTNAALSNRRRRRRRNTDIESGYIPKLSCLDGKCITYKCYIRSLQPGGLTGVKVLFAIYSSALEKLKSDILEPEIDVKFGGKYGKLLHQRQNDDCHENIQFEQQIHFAGRIEQTPKKKVEWWIILVAVVGALIILAIFCSILYRIGFFKRHRPDDEQALQGREEKYERNASYEDD